MMLRKKYCRELISCILFSNSMNIISHKHIVFFFFFFFFNGYLSDFNGYLSDFFDISRGIRQGCPVSALLFLLCVEILGIKLRANNSLQGFCFGQSLNPIKLAQYADDCILFLNSKSEVCSALNILKGFGQLSGLILNIDKCEGLWLGKDKNLQRHCNLFGIKWPE